MKTKLITKSFERLLDKGKHRGFITYEELGKSLGKRHYSQENIEKFSLVIQRKFQKQLILILVQRLDDMNSKYIQLKSSTLKS